MSLCFCIVVCLLTGFESSSSPPLVPSTSPFHSLSLLPSFSTSTIASMTLLLLITSTHRPKAISISRAQVSTAALCGAYVSFISMSACFCRLGRSTLRGEFGLLGLLGHVLTFLLAILVVFASAATLCVSLHTVNPFATLPRPPASLMCRLFASTGELSDLTLFGGIPMISGVLAVNFASIRVRACPMHLHRS